MAYGGIIVPLATAAPPLLVYLRRKDTSRSAAVLFWAPAPVLLAAIAVEAVLLCSRSELPVPLCLFVVVTVPMLIGAYVLLGRDLPRVLDKLIAADDRRRLEELTRTGAITPPTILDVGPPAAADGD
jgi:hypothetical protein